MKGEEGKKHIETMYMRQFTISMTAGSMFPSADD